MKLHCERGIVEKVLLCGEGRGLHCSKERRSSHDFKVSITREGQLEVKRGRMGPSTRRTTKASREKKVALKKVYVKVPRSMEDFKELEDDLTRMGCVGLLHHPWGMLEERVVKELLPGNEVPREFESTMRGNDAMWAAEVWRQVYSLGHGEEGFAKEDYVQGKFSKDIHVSYGYYIKDCVNPREQRVLAFMAPILNPNKLNSVSISLESTLLLALDGKREVDWAAFI